MIVEICDRPIGELKFRGPHEFFQKTEDLPQSDVEILDQRLELDEVDLLVLSLALWDKWATLYVNKVQLEICLHPQKHLESERHLRLLISLHGCHIRHEDPEVFLAETIG